MAEDAIGDVVAEANAFSGLRLRRSDPRITKPHRKVGVWTFEQMREFATGGRPEIRTQTERPPDPRAKRPKGNRERRFYSAHDYEAMLLTPGLTGLRLGEFLALHRSDFDGSLLSFRFSAHEGELVESSEQKKPRALGPRPT
jgi:integrase